MASIRRWDSINHMVLMKDIHEGQGLCIPLNDGTFALGIIARENPNKAILGYFLPRRFAQKPTSVTADFRLDLYWIHIFGIPRTGKKDWETIPLAGVWDRDRWPVPPFSAYSEEDDMASLFYYNDTDLLTPVRTERCSPEVAKRYFQHSVANAAFIEDWLNMYLPPLDDPSGEIPLCILKRHV